VAESSDPVALRVLELERKVANLERALVSQRSIGIAIGLLAQWNGCTTDTAWGQLSRISQVTNTKVRDVARILRESIDDAPGRTQADALAHLCRILGDGSGGSATTSIR